MSTLFREMSANQVCAVHGFSHVCPKDKSKRQDSLIEGHFQYIVLTQERRHHGDQFWGFAVVVLPSYYTELVFRGHIYSFYCCPSSIYLMYGKLPGSQWESRTDCFKHKDVLDVLEILSDVKMRTSLIFFKNNKNYKRFISKSDK